MTNFKSVALAALMGVLSQGAMADEAFRIGAILPFSGPYAFGGEAAKAGMQMAIDERGGKVLGVPIEVSWEDGEANPQTTLKKGTRLIADDVHLLVGEASSPATLALSKLAGRRKVPLLNTISADERITGSEGNRYTFRTSNDFGMETQMTISYFEAVRPKSVYAVIPDVGAARDMWGKVKDALPGLGVAIAGEDYPPLGNKDYAVIVNKIANSGAESVLAVLAGGDAVNFLKQAGEVGLTGKVEIFGPTLIEELTAAAVGDASLGVFSGVRYHFSYKNEQNQKFVAAYKEKFGELPSVFAGEAYDGLSWFLDTVEETGSWDKEAWVDAFSGSVRDTSIEGVKTMRSCNNQAEQIGLMAMVGRGIGDEPELTMQIVEEFPIKALFTDCP